MVKGEDSRGADCGREGEEREKEKGKGRVEGYRIRKKGVAEREKETRQTEVAGEREIEGR